MRLRCLLALFIILAVTPSARAHPLAQNAMWVVFAPDRIRVAVNVSVREIGIAQQVPATDGNFDRDELDAAAKRDGDYLLRHLTLAAEGRELAGRVVKVTPPATIGTNTEQTFYQYEIEYPLTAAPPARIAFRQEMLREFSYAPGQSWDVSYVLRLKRSDTPEVTTGLLRGQATTEFPTGFDDASAQVDAARTFRDYLRHGVWHILTGYDHLLFVTALVLATMSFWEMVKVIAAFTVAHTLTLVLSVLNIFRLPPWIVEPVISASIVFVAVENIVWPNRTRGWLRLGVAFGFGLVHGLGFAGGLLDAMEGLPRLGLGIALLSFSLGVEIGHQLVVLPLFGALRLGQAKWRTPFRAAVLRYGSGAISLAGVYYFIVAVTAA